MASGRLERRLVAVMGSFLLSEERRSWLGAEQRAADVITESVLSSAAALSLDTAEVMAPSQTGKCITCMNQVVISDLCGSLAFRAQVRPVLREPVKDVCYERLLSPTPRRCFSLRSVTPLNKAAAPASVPSPVFPEKTLGV